LDSDDDSDEDYDPDDIDSDEGEKSDYNSGDSVEPVSATGLQRKQGSKQNKLNSKERNAAGPAKKTARLNEGDNII